MLRNVLRTSGSVTLASGALQIGLLLLYYYLQMAGHGLRVVDTRYGGKWAWLAGLGPCMASSPEWQAGRHGSGVF